MTRAEWEPPDREKAAAGSSLPPTAATPNTDHRKETGSSDLSAVKPVCVQSAPQDICPQLRRRREAASRMEPLAHSGRRDPWSR